MSDSSFLDPTNPGRGEGDSIETSLFVLFVYILLNTSYYDPLTINGLLKYLKNIIFVY
jgi:hypothetical protein